MFTVPDDIKADTQYNKIKLYRAFHENDPQGIIPTLNYVEIKEVDISSGGAYTTYIDDDTDKNSRNLFYYVRFWKSVELIESYVELTFFEVTPRELRIIRDIKNFMPQKLLGILVQEDYRHGIRMAIQAFNTQPPLTGYDITSFPYEGYELFLGLGSTVFTIFKKYLYISFKDFNHSDSGLSFNVDRAPKMMVAVDNLMGIYNPLMKTAKLDLMSDVQTGMGLGTFQMPLGGGRIAAGILDVLDIFTRLS